MYFGYRASDSWFPSPQPNSITDRTPLLSTNALTTSALNPASWPNDPGPDEPPPAYQRSQYRADPGNTLLETHAFADIAAGPRRGTDLIRRLIVDTTSEFTRSLTPRGGGVGRGGISSLAASDGGAAGRAGGCGAIGLGSDVPVEVPGATLEPDEPAPSPFVPGDPGAGACSFIPSLISRRMSADAFRNSLMALPTVLPISGSFLGPKSSSARVRIRINSMGPMLNI